MDARISTSLPSHPKTKKLARRLGPAGPLACIYLFLWVAANRSDGDLSGLTDEDLELAVDWQGEEGQFVSVMSEVGFLDGEQGGRRVHDWAVHNPWAAGANDRSEASRWAALCKRYGREGAAKRMPDYASRMRPAHDPDAIRTHPHCDPDAPSPLPSPLPNPSPNQEKKKAPAKPAASLIPEIPEKLMRDFLAVRRAKKQPLTETAVDGIRAQAEKAGLTIEQAIKICCENSWAGFRASWDWEGKKGGQANGSVYDPSVAGGGRREL